MTSGSSRWSGVSVSVPAQSQTEAPAAQCALAWSRVRYCRCGCLSTTIRLTWSRLRRQCSAIDRVVLASAGSQIRTTPGANGIAVSIQSRPLVREAVVGRCAKQVEVSSTLSDATGSRHGSSAGVLQPLGVLDQHGRGHHREGLVGGEDAVPAGQQIALEPALAEMLGEHFHDRPSGDRWSSVARTGACRQRSVASKTAASRLLAVSSGQNNRKSPPPSARWWPRRTSRRSSPSGWVFSCDVTAGRPAPPGRSAAGRQVPGRAGSRPPLAYGEADIRLSPSGASAANSGDEAAVGVEQRLGRVRVQPLLEPPQVFRVLPDLRQGYLVGAERTFDRHAVHDVGPGPPLRRTQNDRRPAAPCPPP